MWFLSREAQYRIALLKDGMGNYLLQRGLAAGPPDTLLGYPVTVSEYMTGSDWNSNDYIAVFGNPRFYLICDSMSGFQIQTLVELYAKTNQNAYHVRFESDGNITDPNAWVRLQLR